jgi:hypothetical protein
MGILDIGQSPKMMLLSFREAQLEPASPLSRDPAGDCCAGRGRFSAACSSRLIKIFNWFGDIHWALG